MYVCSWMANLAYVKLEYNIVKVRIERLNFLEIVVGIQEPHYFVLLLLLPCEIPNAFKDPIGEYHV